jgi:hypothetical protein
MINTRQAAISDYNVTKLDIDFLKSRTKKNALAMFQTLNNSWVHESQGNSKTYGYRTRNIIKELCTPTN